MPITKKPMGEYGFLFSGNSSLALSVLNDGSIKPYITARYLHFEAFYGTWGKPRIETGYFF
jgi:hypothetical protein